LPNASKTIAVEDRRTDASTGFLQLPFHFDLPELLHELHGLPDAGWYQHFNTRAYDQGWSALPLRAVGGRMDDIVPIEGGDFHDTAWMAQCPAMARVIDSFNCAKTSVRLMALGPGARILPHRDAGGALEDGLTRLHVPLQTTPDVLFCIDGQYIHFAAGQTWYLNASCEHDVYNPGPNARVHLMIDCVTNPWLEAVFAAAGGICRPLPVYGDAAINDGNVQEAIAALLAAGHPAGLAVARSLQAVAASRL
jgi:Aspartyl/Asparaginyl beta-hydroxylase